ncbi:hypothetical protein DIPPA_10150 [Diplonema papillatum]|nr:hypothetical protein DIPPA_10150 [Diplonema papillatum]|eukprot:gene13075-20168_t
MFKLWESWELIQPGPTHVFCFCSLVGGIGMVLAGVTGWLSVVEDEDYDGSCQVTAVQAACECARWTSEHYCEAFEAVFQTATFTATEEAAAERLSGASTSCALKLGPGSIASCFAANLAQDPAFGDLSGASATAAVSGSIAQCRLRTDTHDCFSAKESAEAEAKRSFLALCIGGSVWAFVSLLSLTVLCVLHCRERQTRHQALRDDIDLSQDTEPSHRPPCTVVHTPSALTANVLDPASRPGQAAARAAIVPERCGAYLKGDRVVYQDEAAPNWIPAVVLSRDTATTYTVKADATGDEIAGLRLSDMRSAGFTTGGWVAAMEYIASPPDQSGVESRIEPGDLGVVLSVLESGCVEVSMSGALLTVQPGHVVPTPAVRRLQKVEAKAGAESPWEECLVEGLIGDNLLQVSSVRDSEGRVFEANFVRRPAGIVVQQLPMPDKPEEPTSFVFVDPDSRLAPIIMTREEVQLYGGVRNVSKDLAEYKAAPAGKLMVSAAMLTTAHLAAQHIARAERHAEAKTPWIPPTAGPPRKPSASPASQPAHEQRRDSLSNTLPVQATAPF